MSVLYLLHLIFRNCLKYLFILLFQDTWRTTALITAFFPIVSQIFLYFFMSESPAWLVNQNKIESAEKSLSKIRCIGITSPKLKDEIEHLVANKIKNRDNYSSELNLSKRLVQKLHYFIKPVCLKPFVIMVLFFFFQQSSGTFVIVFYAVDFVKEAGVSIDPYIAAILIALARVIASMLLGPVCRRYGRRPPTIISGAIMTLTMVTLAAYIYSLSLGVVPTETQSRLNWLPVFLVIFYFFTATFGFLTIPFAMIAEMFPTKIRGFAGGLVACLNYTFNFIFVKTYQGMLESMGKHGVFAFYGGMALVGTIFVVIFLPETKGKTLAQIEEYFSGGRKRQEEQTELKEEV